jgi:hypothetical protein
MTHPQVNDRVEVDGVSGLVRWVEIENTVRDPLLGEPLEPQEGDPVLMLDTEDGPMAALASECKALTPAPFEGDADPDDFDPLLEMLAVRAEEKGNADGPPGSTTREVYRRGLCAWPGAEVTSMDSTEWALARTNAFLDKAEGKTVQGYTGDDDLLPASDS